MKNEIKQLLKDVLEMKASITAAGEEHIDKETQLFASGSLKTLETIEKRLKIILNDE